MHDLPVSLTAGEPQTLEMTLPLPETRLSPGQPADGPPSAFSSSRRAARRALRRAHAVVRLFRRAREIRYSAAPRRMSRSRALLARIGRLCLPGVRLDVPAPDAFYRAMTLSGVSVLHPFATQALRERLARHACVVFGDAPLSRMRSLPALDAWLLCGLTACPRTARGRHARRAASRAAGRELDAQSPNIAAVLLWLRAVRIRLLAEAAAAGALFRRALPARRLAGRGCIRRPANRARADAPERPAPVRRVVRGFGLQRVGPRSSMRGTQTTR